MRPVHERRQVMSGASCSAVCVLVSAEPGFYLRENPVVYDALQDFFYGVEEGYGTFGVGALRVVSWLWYWGHVQLSKWSWDASGLVNCVQEQQQDRMHRWQFFEQFHRQSVRTWCFSACHMG